MADEVELQGPNADEGRAQVELANPELANNPYWRFLRDIAFALYLAEFGRA